MPRGADRSLHELWVAPMAAAVLLACQPRCDSRVSVDAGGPAADRAESPWTALRLDYRPRHAATATLVCVERGGDVRTFRFSPNLLEVVLLKRGTVPLAAADGLFARVDAAGFRAAPAHQSFAGSGLEEGDPFHFVIDGDVDGETARSCSGLEHKAPDPIRGLIGELLALEGRLEETPLAEAYLWSEAIPTERLQRLREAGRVSFTTLQELPAELRPVVQPSLHRRRDFRPIGREQHDSLLEWCSPGREIFVAQEERAHQLTLFGSRFNQREPPR